MRVLVRRAQTAEQDVPDDPGSSSIFVAAFGGNGHRDFCWWKDPSAVWRSARGTSHIARAVLVIHRHQPVQGGVLGGPGRSRDQSRYEYTTGITPARITLASATSAPMRRAKNALTIVSSPAATIA